MSGGMDRIEPEPIELVLYVSASSPHADAAVEKMRGALARFSSPKVRLTVCRLPDGDGSAAAAEPRIAIVPIRQSGTVRTLILGHITHPDILLELLKDCDFDS
jgi:hypothetical protein